jgi:hypothetical protein
MDFDRLAFGMFGVVALVYGLLGFLLPFLLIYMLGYVRRRGDDRPDAMLGARVFLTLLLSISVQIVIFGISQMLAEMMDEPPARSSYSGLVGSRGNESNWKLAKGLVNGGSLAALYPATLYLLLRRRHRGPDPVLRSALGVNALFTGLIFVGAVTALMVSAMSDTGGGEMYGQLGMTVVYLIAGLGFGAPLAFSSPDYAPRREGPLTIGPSV